MRRLYILMIGLLLASSPAFGQTKPSDYPLATLPLTGTDAVLLDQCTSLGPPPVGCVTSQAPSTRIGQPVVSAVQPLSPFLFQNWWNTGVSPAQYSIYNGAVFVPVYQVDQSTGIPSFPGNVYLPTGDLAIGTATTVPNWPITLFVNNTPSGAQSVTINAAENGSGVAGSLYRGFTLRGPSTSAAAVQTNDILVGLHGSGYWSGKVNPYYIPNDQRAAINMIATENWTGVNNNGTAIVFLTTPLASNTMAEVARFDGAGNFGIGTTTPVSGVTLTRNNVAATLPQGYTQQIYENGSGVVGGAYRGFSTRGSSASPTNLISGDTLAALQGGGFYTGKAASTFGVGDSRAQIGMFAGETWSGPNNNGTYVTISTTHNATGTMSERLRVFGSGGMALGATNDPGVGSFDLTGALMVGFSVIPTVETGGIAIAKITAAGTAPGAGAAKFVVVAGTTGGTCKLVMYAGTSTTPTTVIDNVGSGC